MTYVEAARAYFDRGWTTIPLMLDDNGLPKRPFSNGWQGTPHEWRAIESLPWDRARGLGIVLGPVSDNLAVIDIDDDVFATFLLDTLLAAKAERFYYVRTGRNRCHLYFREGQATSPRTLNGIQWRDRTFGVELKSQGQQVAAPPTPNYHQLGSSPDPTPVGTLAQAWDALIAGFGLTVPGALRSGTAGYPRAWQESIKEGERNNAVYVESCRLAEAGMPLDSAIATMLARVQTAYEGPVDERGIVATIRSAYRKVHKPLRGWITV